MTGPDVARRLSDVLPRQAIRPAGESHPFRVPGAEPAPVAMPENESQVSAVMRIAGVEGWGVVAAGHGGGLHIGNPPRRADLVLSTARMGALRDYEPADLTLVAEAGTRFGSLQADLLRHGQFLPLDPPGAADATLGGIAAVGWSGSLRPGFGLPRDAVLGMRVVGADGVATRSGGRVVKNVAGYDLHRLYAGSFGTLAVITEISLRVRPIPDGDETIIFTSRSWLPLMTVAARTLVEPWPITSCDLLTPSLASRTGASAGTGYALAMRAMAGQATADDLVRRVAALAVSEGLEETSRIGGPLSAAFWKGTTETEILSDDALTVRVATAPGFLAGVLGEAERALPDGCGLEFHAHATSGVARLFVRSEAGTIAAWVGALRARAAATGGHVIVERMPESLVGRLDTWGSRIPSAALARRVKQAFDPKGILSPGRFADGV